MAGIYIHVPFCRSKCAYCDFYSLPRIERYAERYVAAIETELSLRIGELADAQPIDTVYIGGGTPSALSSELLGRVVTSVMRHVEPSALREFTIEVNPDDVTEEKASLWHSLGVNRISMGVQSLNPAELLAVGRRHTARQALGAVGILRKYFQNISLDLIVGLPGQTRASLADSLRGTLELRPEHLSVYILSYEPGTRLETLRRIGKIRPVDEDTIVEMYGDVCTALREAGYVHYEISNYCLPGHASIHNSSYWNDTPYLGIGPAAHSYTRRLRRYNPSNLQQWLEKLEAGTQACQIEYENQADQTNDRIMTALRTAEGLNVNRIPECFREYVLRTAAGLPAGRIEIKRFNDSETVLTIPETAWLVSDDTIASLFVDSTLEG